MIDNGHTIQVNYAPGSSIDVGGARYELVQFHFHKPSEEKIDGKAHAMVAHLVHKSGDGKLAVVAVLLDKGGATRRSTRSGSNLPKEKEKEVAYDVDVDATALLPDDKRLLHVHGIADHAAVQRGRRWFVLKTPMTIADGESRIRQDLSDERPADSADQWPADESISAL